MLWFDQKTTNVPTSTNTSSLETEVAEVSLFSMWLAYLQHTGGCYQVLQCANHNKTLD